jgi:hypothetical protein
MGSLANAGYTFVAKEPQILTDWEKHSAFSIQKFVMEKVV